MFRCIGRLAGLIPAKIGIAFAAILISGFTVYASNVNEAEPNNAYSTSDTIYANDTVSGSVGPQDLSDFYEITVANTGKLKVKPLATTIGQDYSVWVYIYTPTVSGAGSVTSSYVSAAGTDTLSLSIEPGTYYIRIYNNAATNYKFTTVFKTQEEVANDVGPNEVADSATTIGLDQVVTGRVGYWRGSSTALGNKDKQDYYKIAVTNTGILKVKPQVMTVGQGDSILVEIIPALGIAATGGVYRTYSDTTTDTLAFPVEPGTYYVLIKGDFDGTNYKFITTFQTQEEVPVDVEPNNSGDSAIPIVFGQVLTGRIGYWSPPISATDRMDFYKIIVTNTGILKVKPQAMTIGQNYSIRVDITGANWLTTLTGKAVSSAATDTLAFPVEPGTYYIRIFYYENDPALTYFITNYKFTTSFQTQEDVPVDVELNDTFSHAATIGLNQVVTGRIGYYSPNFSTVDSSDYYKIAIATAGKLDVKPQAITAGQDYSVEAQIFAADGKTSLLKGTVSATGTDTLALAVAPGTYFIRIGVHGATNYKFISLVSSSTTVLSESQLNPGPLRLSASSANGTYFQYFLFNPAYVSLSFYSYDGILIHKSDLGFRNAGSNADFIGDELMPSGDYIFVFNNGRELIKKKYSKAR